jgi:hypothetical protein
MRATLFFASMLYETKLFTQFELCGVEWVSTACRKRTGLCFSRTRPLAAGGTDLVAFDEGRD